MRKKKRKPKTQLEPGDYLDAEQVRFVLELLKGEAADGKFRTAVRLFIFQLLVNTGIRRGEAAGVYVSRVYRVQQTRRYYAPCM
ncbi:hypothetical protein LCGC14_2473920 [marine sediment metagenome]|uniref:Tyr recombinase domain-containing protein n=1 Tax=marine sediment metagenome TaxID=412755 RepID=A0A0F9BA97_9ZZZZ